MIPKDSLSSSRERTTGPYSEPDESNLHPNLLFLLKFISNIIVLSTSWSSKCSLLSRFYGLVILTQFNVMKHANAETCAHILPVSYSTILRIEWCNINKLFQCFFTFLLAQTPGWETLGLWHCTSDPLLTNLPLVYSPAKTYCDHCTYGTKYNIAPKITHM